MKLIIEVHKESSRNFRLNNVQLTQVYTIRGSLILPPKWPILRRVGR